MGGKRDAKLFLSAGIFASIALLGFIVLIFNFSRFMFAGQLFLALSFGFLIVVGLTAIYNGLSLGFSFLSMVYALMLLDLLWIYFRIEPIGLAYLATIVSSAIGFVMSVVNVSQERHEKPRHIPKPEVYEVPAVREPALKPVIKTYTPGKVITSKTSSYYHAPKCEWAKKIKKKNRIWFNSSDEAKARGLKPHDCIN